METYQIHNEASVYYLTYSVVDWLPVFVNEDACSVITRSLRFCHDKKGLRINAYVIMPTHLHLIAFNEDHDCALLSDALTAFRKHTARAMLAHCIHHTPAVFTSSFHAAATTDRARRFWQPSRHPIAIQSEKFWRQKLDYLHDNPRRKGFVLYAEDWRFSSARYHTRGEDAYSEVPITDLRW